MVPCMTFGWYNMVVLQASVNSNLSVSGEHVPFIMDGIENSVPLKFTVCAPI